MSLRLSNKQQAKDESLPIKYTRALLNQFIIFVFKKRQFVDVTTFIMRVLHPTPLINYFVRSKYCPNLLIINWFKLVYNIHFQKTDLPLLYALICNFQAYTQQASASTKYILDANKYSKLYVTQKRSNKLHKLSILFDEIYNKSAASTLNLGGEMTLFTYSKILFEKCYISATHYHESSHVLNGMLDCFADIMDILHDCDNLPIDEVRWSSSCDFILIMMRCILVDIAPVSIEIALDSQFMKNINKLCKSRLKMLKLWDIYDTHCIVQVYMLLGHYYFWIKYDRNKAVKYMHKGINIAKKYQNERNQIKSKKLKDYLTDLIVFLAAMEQTVGNYHKCFKLMKWLYDLGDFSKEQYLDCKKTLQPYLFLEKWDQHQPFEKNDAEQDQIRNRIMIKRRKMPLANVEYEHERNDIQNNREIILNKVKPYFVNKYFNIMNNLVKLKHCNYIECQNKHLRRFKVCRRCKSAFYCGRRHQKLDWNEGNHKKYCAERQQRDYHLLEARRNNYVQHFKGDNKYKILTTDSLITFC